MNNSWFNKKNVGLLLFLLAALLTTSSVAQEIDASVAVDRSQINSTSLNFLDNLPREIESYLNEHNWIEANFRPQERVRMDMQITLLSVDNDFNFEAQLIIRTYRPIYNSMQETVLFFFNDEHWEFNYTPNRGLIHDELQFDSFTSVLDFYAYLTLGYDFDSFEEYGGTPYFNEAQNIVSLAQTVSTTGWSRSGSQRNRARLISELLSPTYEEFRSALYQYHRLGLDLFLQNPEEGRGQILQALQQIGNIKRRTSSNLLFDTFFNAKYRELAAVFEDAELQTRLEAYNLLTEIDQSHLSEYQDLQ